MHCFHIQAQVLEAKGDPCNFPSVGDLYGLGTCTVLKARATKYWAKHRLFTGPGTGPIWNGLAVQGNPLQPPPGEPVCIGVNLQKGHAIVIFDEFEMGVPNTNVHIHRLVDCATLSADGERKGMDWAPPLVHIITDESLAVNVVLGGVGMPFGKLATNELFVTKGLIQEALGTGVPIAIKQMVSAGLKCAEVTVDTLFMKANVPHTKMVNIISGSILKSSEIFDHLPPTLGGHLARQMMNSTDPEAHKFLMLRSAFLSIILYKLIKINYIIISLFLL